MMTCKHRQADFTAAQDGPLLWEKTTNWLTQWKKLL